jgi:cytochrome bd-type quinol oxidase subunit 2
VIAVAGAATLLLSVWLLLTRRVDTTARLCTLQALCAAVPLGDRMPAAAILAFALNGVALPSAVMRMRDTPMLVPRGRVLLRWAVAFVLLVVTIVVLGNVGAGGTVATGTSVVLLGLLMAGLRGHPTLYLLSSQNGLLLVASASPDLSVSAALAVAVPLIPGLVLANAWLHP